MIWRLIASIAFLGGGVVTWRVLTVLKGFGASQAAMSAAASHGPPDRDFLFTCLVCSYFVISAFASAFCIRKQALRIAAALAYFMLLATFVGVCVNVATGEVNRMLAGAVSFAAIGLIYFAPWTIIWLLLVTKCEGGSSPSGPGG